MLDHLREKISTVEEDAIWNRALGFGGDRGSGEGDAALQDMLELHGRIMNGGLLDAVETGTPEGVGAAIAGYRWMGLHEAADAVAMVRDEVANCALDDDEAAEALESRANDAYETAIPDDATLDRAFRAKLRDTPSAFQRTD